MTTTEPKAKRAPDRTACGGCRATWTGLSRCHCGGCHTARALSDVAPIKFGDNSVTIASHDMRDQIVNASSGSVVLGPQFKILDAIVGFDAVAMVNGFFGKEATPDMVCHDEAMNVGVPLDVGFRVLSTDVQSAVAVGARHGFALAPVSPLVGAPAVDASGAPRAMTTVGRRTPAVGVLAGLRRLLTRLACWRAPALSVAARRVDHVAHFAGFRRYDLRHAVILASTWSGLTLFDQHRTGGRCTPPEDMTVGGEPLRLVDGIWRSPEMSDEDKAARFGGAR